MGRGTVLTVLLVVFLAAQTECRRYDSRKNISPVDNYRGMSNTEKAIWASVIVVFIGIGVVIFFLCRHRIVAYSHRPTRATSRTPRDSVIGWKNPTETPHIQTWPAHYPQKSWPQGTCPQGVAVHVPTDTVTTWAASDNAKTFTTWPGNNQNTPKNSKKWAMWP